MCTEKHIQLICPNNTPKVLKMGPLESEATHIICRKSTKGMRQIWTVFYKTICFISYVPVCFV